MGKILAVKIKTEKGTGGTCQFKTQINSEDFKQVACLLRDLETYGINIEGAMKEFKKNRGALFPW